jgi:HlyD family secretion protein
MSALPSPSPARAPESLGPTVVKELPKKPRNPFVLFGLLLIVIAAAVGLWTLRKPAQKPQSAVVTVKTAKAFVAPLEITLRMTGNTAAQRFANITMPILQAPETRGNLVLLELAKSGSFAHKGDILVRIDGQAVEDHLIDVRDMVAGAENDIKKLEAQQKVEWENLQQTLRVAKASFEKAKLDASAAEVKTDVERELLKLARDESEARYKQQQNDLALRKASQEADLKIAQITLEWQHRHYRRHEKDLRSLTIRAPMDGLVVLASIYRGGELAQIQAGDQVWPGQQLLKVVDTSNMQVDGSVSQADSSDLRLSQVAHIGFDAFKDLKFEGRILSIGALAVGGWRQNYFIRNVPVKVKILGSDPRLIPDLSAHCNIILETIQNKVQVPTSAVRFHNGKNFVNVKTATGFELREVQIGKQNNMQTAIDGGLREGEEVQIGS